MTTYILGGGFFLTFTPAVTLEILFLICNITIMFEYRRLLAVERPAGSFPGSALIYCLHSYVVILVLEFEDPLHPFSKGELPAHPLLMDVHGWSFCVTVYTVTHNSS